MINSFNSDNNLTSPKKLDEDKQNENSLRPLSFDDFIEQADIIENLKIYIKATKNRGESLVVDHNNAVIKLKNKGYLHQF